MSTAYILSACRTPIGRFQGDFASVAASDLAAVAIREAIRRTGLLDAEVDEVILGHVLSAGVGQAPARQAALRAGLPETVAACSVNKVCGSGLKAVILADQAIRSGDAKLVVAGGMESMSRCGWLLQRGQRALGDQQLTDWMLHDGLTCAMTGDSMGAIADQLAARAKISRPTQDRFALESHRRAIEAIDAGAFAEEIVPVAVNTKNGAIEISSDSGPRRETTLEQLAELRPVFGKEGSVTAGNASMISDGAAAVVVADASVAERSVVHPLCRIVATATSGGAPQDLFTAPVAAIREVIRKAEYSLQEIDLFEINEAFAVQMVACIDQLDIPHSRVNIHGGAIALGHPIGTSGARVLVTLLNAMQRHEKRLGIAALCLGGGNAVAMLVDREI
ncbi:Acetyl-CoA acetyltransferase [Rosistilla carotiformis]|uniref:Acetyl-CoA acetyltransferase n=1 Tax=Rosistilla carotiformis TaxID=2528017 RepID=A0A518JWQ1_9BACT|nr:thiolase family protein [Rosistilla carotiformis]QDV69981.1 Acetyl-CoA acetyltransferase [Rosistilla carotiformis]